MSETKEMSKRDQVLEMLKEGGHTRDEIAQKLEMSTASVSSQFTYLRWMGYYIIYDENKILSLVDQDEYEKWQAEKERNKKTKAVSTRTPEEQAEALEKTLGNQTKQLDNWREKLVKIDADMEKMPNDEELQDMQAEAQANITLLEIKMKRNKAKLESLGDDLDFDDDDDDDNGDDELL